MGVPLSPPPPGETVDTPSGSVSKVRGLTQPSPLPYSPPPRPNPSPLKVPQHQVFPSILPWLPPGSPPVQPWGSSLRPAPERPLSGRAPPPPSLSAGPQVSSQVNSRSPGRAPRPLTCGTEPAGTGIPL